MIHQKRLIAYILVFTIILIFFMNIDSSNAAQVAIPLGVELGVPMAKAFLGFLLASRASGLAFDSYEQAREMFKVIPGGQSNDNPPPNDPPPDEQGPDGKFTWKDFLGLGLIGGAVTQQLKDFIDAFKAKFGEVQEGENTIGNDTVLVVDPNFGYLLPPDSYYGDYNLSYYKNGHLLNVVKVGQEIDIYINGDHKLYLNYFISLKSISVIQINDGIQFKVTVRQKNGDFTIPYTQYDIDPTVPIPTQNSITYYITNNAPILDPVQNPPPETVYIPYLPTIDPDNDRFKEVMLPTGEKELRYEGTPDDYLDDVVNNVTFTQIQTGAVPGVTVTPTEEGYIILEPGTNELPYPEIGTDPFPDTGQGLGTIAGLIKAIINWLSNIYNAILSIPKFLTNLFTIPEGLSIDTSNLRMNGFTEKFPFSIPWDLYNAINVFASSPSNPDISVNIDTDNLKINHTVDLSLIDLPLRFARYAVTIFFIIFLASKTRDLIKW